MSAHKHLYIDKMGHNSATLYQHKFHRKPMGRQETRRTCRNSRATRQRIPSTGWHFPLSASTYFSRNILGSIGTKQIHDSTQPHTITKKRLRYLKGRKNVTLRWCAQDCTGAHLPGTTYGYADASFADTIPHRHSLVGHVFMLNGAAISWRASRTSLIVLNAAEAKL